MRGTMKLPRPSRMGRVGRALGPALSLLLLSACGGGGGDKISTPEFVPPAATPVPVLPQAFSATLDGTVAVGAPVVGAEVEARCLNGRARAQAPSDVLGGFHLELGDLKPPCLLQSRGGTALGTPVSQLMHGLALATGQAPIHPLTELQLARAYGAEPAQVFARFAGAADVPSSQALADSAQFMTRQLSALGLKTPSGDLLSETFRLGAATDQVLDQLSATLTRHESSLAQLRSSAQSAGDFSLALATAKAAADERARLAAEAAAAAKRLRAEQAAAAAAAAKAAEDARLAAEAKARAAEEEARRLAAEAAARAAEAAAKAAAEKAQAEAAAAAAKAAAEAAAKAAAEAKAKAEAEAAAAAAAEAARLAELIRQAELVRQATVTGVALNGEPIRGASVQVRCVGGNAPTDTLTDAEGGFSIKLLGATAPCLFQAQGGSVGNQTNSQRLHGWVDRMGGTVQISPLSELSLAHAFADSPANVFAAGSQLMTPPASSSLEAGKSWLRGELASLSLATPAADLLAGPIRAGDSDAQLMTALNSLLEDRASSLAAAIQVARARGGLAATLNADRQVAIQFAAVAGSTPVSCTQPLPAMGSTAAVSRLLDFRFYLSGASLIRADGSLVPIRLTANNGWNHTANNGDSVTLIDLEDGSGSCADSPEPTTAASNAWLSGTVPAGRYVGFRATLGVPHSLNHSQTSSAPAPLDNAAMGWSWQAGRKFMKIEVTQPSGGGWASDSFFVHLGSTSCTGNAGLGTVVCAKPNRGIVHLPSFDAASQKIAVDIAALLAGTNITINQGGAQGCMSAGTDRDCLKVFEALGIDWKSDGSGSGLPLNDGLSQTVFRAISK